MSGELSLDSIKAEALRLGWDDVGVTSATIPEADQKAYFTWLDHGDHAEMGYMENRMRCYPEQLLPGAKSAIIFVSYYKQEQRPFQKELGLIASYARGRNYHHVHFKRLKQFVQWMESETQKTGIAKPFSDSSPILEKALAVQAGLGWFGKNTLLIHRRFGTFTLLSGVLTTLDLSSAYTNSQAFDMRMPRCGVCTKCVDACPTKALVSPYRLNANLCLSYHTIESKKEIPQQIAVKNPGYVFGCDICQDVCPHNVRKMISPSKEFAPESGPGAYLSSQQISEIEMNPEVLFGTSLQRRKGNGLKHTMTRCFAHD